MTVKTAPNLICLHTFKIDKTAPQVSINGVAISADRTKIAAIKTADSHSHRWQLMAWNLKTWNQQASEIATGNGSGSEDAAVNSLAFSADGRSIAIASGACHQYPGLSIWDTMTQSSTPAQPLDIGEGFLAVANHPTKLQFATAGWSGKIQTWQAPHDHRYIRSIKSWEAHRWETHQGTAYAMVYSPNGKLLCSGGTDHLVKIWNSQSGSLIQTLIGHDRAIRSVAFSSDIATVVSGSDQRIKIWNTFTGELRHSFFGHCDWVRGLAITFDGQFLISAGDAKIKIWDLKTGKKLSAIVAHDGAICSIALNKDLLVTGSIDGTVKVWQLQ